MKSVVNNEPSMYALEKLGRESDQYAALLAGAEFEIRAAVNRIAAAPLEATRHLG